MHNFALFVVNPFCLFFSLHACDKLWIFSIFLHWIVMTEIRSLSLHFELWRQMCGKPAIILYISSRWRLCKENMCICVYGMRDGIHYIVIIPHTQIEVLMVNLWCLYINNFPLSLLLTHSHLSLAPAQTCHCISSLCTHIWNCVCIRLADIGGFFLK